MLKCRPSNRKIKVNKKNLTERPFDIDLGYISIIHIFDKKKDVLYKFSLTNYNKLLLYFICYHTRLLYIYIIIGQLM